MANARTTSLHEKLPVELRQQVERDLIDQPPGRETYAKVHEHYGLGEMDISIKAVERYGGYLRALKRNERVRQIAGELLGDVDLKPQIEGQIRGKLFEMLVADDMRTGDLLKAALTEKALRETVIKSETWEAKKREMEQELDRISRDAEHRGRGLTPEVLAEIKSKVLGI